METPSWFDTSKISGSLDAREMLGRGEHPLPIVLEKAAALEQGSIFELITPFPPQPLIEKVRALGCDSFTQTTAPGEMHTYFYKS